MEKRKDRLLLLSGIEIFLLGTILFYLFFLVIIILFKFL